MTKKIIDLYSDCITFRLSETKPREDRATMFKVVDFSPCRELDQMEDVAAPTHDATLCIVTPADHVEVIDPMASLSAFKQDGTPLWRIIGGMPATMASKMLTRCVDTDRARIDELEGYFTDDGHMCASITGHAPLDLVQEFMMMCERHNEGLASPD